MPLQDNVTALRGRNGRPSNAVSEHRQTLTHLDDTSYDPTHYYVTSTNEHDHDEQVRVRMPRWLALELQQLVKDENYPAYRSTHDVVRDAIVHRVKYLRDNTFSDADTGWINLEIQRGEIALDDARRQARIDIYEAARASLTAAHATRNAEMIEVARARARRVAEDIGEPYASEIRIQLATTYVDMTNAANVPAEELWLN